MQRTSHPISTGLIIIGAFALATLSFALVTYFLVRSSPPDPDGMPSGLGLPALPIAVGLSVVTLTVPMFVRNLLAAQVATQRSAARNEVAEGKIPVELMKASIVGGALAEGPGMLATSLALVEKSPLLLVPAGAAVVALLLLLPTRARLEVLVDR